MVGGEVKPYGTGKAENLHQTVARGLVDPDIPPPPAEHPGADFVGWLWNPITCVWFKVPKEKSPVVVQPPEREHGGTMEIRFEGDTYADCVAQMENAVDEWNGDAEGGPGTVDAAAAATAPKKRGRKPKLAALASPAVPGAPMPPPVNGAAPAHADRVWNVCQFHAQATAKLGKSSRPVAPHECDGCRTMAAGQSFEALLGPVNTALTPAAATPASAPWTPSPAAVNSQPPTGMSVENVKQVMRELVGAKIKAAGAKTDSEVEAAAKPIGDWLAQNFKAASGQPCAMASEIQVGDYGRFVELASKLAADTVTVKKSMFD